MTATGEPGPLRGGGRRPGRGTRDRLGGAVGGELSDPGAKRIGLLYAAEPGYLVIAPRASGKLRPRETALGLKRFPEAGLVATSWQRRLVCRSASAKAVNALRAFVRAYRGTGPGQLAAVNSTSPRPDDLPAPATATPEPS